MMVLLAFFTADRPDGIFRGIVLGAREHKKTCSSAHEIAKDLQPFGKQISETDTEIEGEEAVKFRNIVKSNCRIKLSDKIRSA